MLFTEAASSLSIDYKLHVTSLLQQLINLHQCWSRLHLDYAFSTYLIINKILCIELTKIKSDTCGIWTHAPDGINLAG